MLIHKSPGYISDIEKGRVGPPSVTVIVSMAAVLGADRQALLAAGGKVDPELATYLLKEPEAADFIRMARARGFYADDWARLNQLAEIAQLGKCEDQN